MGGARVSSRRPVRIANCSGFYGDRMSAAREMVEGGPIDVLTGDYLAELTMALLYKARVKNPDAGYAMSFLAQMSEVLPTCVERGIKVVVNAGGLNPAGLAATLRSAATSLGVQVSVAHVEGDDLLPRLEELRPHLTHLDTGAALDRPVLTANAYLGAWGIVEALRGGTDVVVTGRVTDAALTVGPAAWWHDWTRDQLDELAGATVAGHVLECGAQATGGNYAFFAREIADPVEPGFPLAEIAADGSSVITKHPGTGGAVTVGTVTAQLLYEIGAPRYPTPDVTVRFDTVELAAEGQDRVRISGVRGEPPPPTAKVCLNVAGGFRNSMTFVLAGLDVEEKAAFLKKALLARLDARGGRPAAIVCDLMRSDREDPAVFTDSVSYLRVVVKDPDAAKVGRGFSGACIELALASYPGFYATSPPGRESGYAVYWPALVPVDEVEHVGVLPDGTRTVVPHPERAAAVEPLESPGLPSVLSPGPTERVPLGTVFGARSGDKGGNANVGVWATTDDGWRWLAHELTVERVKELLPETAPLEVQRHLLPHLRAVNVVVVGLLGEGVASSTRADAQAKALGEWLRARHVDLPVALLR